jgi:translation initiation factor IF-3
VVDHDGEQLGIMPIEEALAVAEDQDLDLVEVAPNSDPPVCRIMDFGRFKYQQSKRSQEAKKRQKIIHVKEVKMRPKTEAHDFQFKAKHIRRFLDEGNKAKVTIMFRGREMAHQHLGMRLLTRMIEELKDVAQVEQEPTQEGRNMIMVLAPASTKNN